MKSTAVSGVKESLKSCASKVSEPGQFKAAPPPESRAEAEKRRTAGNPEEQGTRKEEEEKRAGRAGKRAVRPSVRSSLPVLFFLVSGPSWLPAAIPCVAGATVSWPGDGLPFA